MKIFSLMALFLSLHTPSFGFKYNDFSDQCKYVGKGTPNRPTSANSCACNNSTVFIDPYVYVCDKSEKSGSRYLDLDEMDLTLDEYFCMNKNEGEFVRGKCYCAGINPITDSFLQNCSDKKLTNRTNSEKWTLLNEYSNYLMKYTCDQFNLENCTSISIKTFFKKSNDTNEMTIKSNGKTLSFTIDLKTNKILYKDQSQSLKGWNKVNY
jgi:hypothetical protein